MASNNKFHDIIGFLDEVETVPGVWTPEIVEHFCTGDVIPNYIRNDSSDINDSVILNDKFSILADTYTLKHIRDIRYVRYMDTNWKVTNIERALPRLIVTVGGVYNEQNEA